MLKSLILNKSIRLIAFIVLHCSASTHGDAKLLKQWHIRQGFDTIGYHYVIKRDGTIENGRDVDIKGAHVKNHNSNSIGVCLIGTPKQGYTKIQYKSLKEFLKRLKILYSLPVKAIKGHYEFNKYKTCPGIDMNAYRDTLSQPE